jgi:hypothetical protein
MINSARAMMCREILRYGTDCQLRRTNWQSPLAETARATFPRS